MNYLRNDDQNDSCSLRFNGMDVTFDPRLFRFLALEAAIMPKARAAAKVLDQKFDSEFTDINGFIDNINAFLKSAYAPLAEVAVQILSQLGCYDCNEKDFLKEYVFPHFEEIQSIRERLMLECSQIAEEQERRNQARVVRRQANVIFNGSDTSVEKVFNGFGRIGDAISNESKRRDLFKNARPEIKKEILGICYIMPDLVSIAASQSTGVDYRDPRSNEDYEKAKRIFNNLKNGNVREDLVDNAAAEVFSRNPNEDGFMEWCVDRYGDAEGDLQRAADLFHIDLSSAKLKKMKTVVHLSSEKEAIESKQKLEELQKQLSCDASELMKSIDDALAKFDLKARTVSGVEYKTREEANQAAQKLEQDKTGQIVIKFNLPQNDAAEVARRYLALERSLLPDLKLFDPTESASADLAQKFNVPSDDIVLGFIDLYNNGESGILISRKGIYCRTSGSAAGISSDKFMLMVIIGLIIWPLLIVAILLKAGGKISQKAVSFFTRWSDISLSRSSDRKKLFFTGQNCIPYPDGVRIFEPLNNLVKAQKEIGG